jgi:hypothetical protein
MPERCVESKQQTSLQLRLFPPHYEDMPSDRHSLESLKNLITETNLLISTTVALPENRTTRCGELLQAALALTDDLLNTTAAEISRPKKFASDKPTFI